MKVFLSYASSDALAARELAAALRAEGHEVWLPDDLPAGENLPLETGRALEDSDAMVLLISPDAMKSGNVQREMAFALGEPRYANRLLSVIVKETSDIPWILRRLHLIHPEKTWSRTAARVARVLATKRAAS
jgi:hypothetical protein